MRKQILVIATCRSQGVSQLCYHVVKCIVPHPSKRQREHWVLSEMLPHFLAGVHNLESLEITAIVDGVAVLVEPVFEERLQRAQHQGFAETARACADADVVAAFDQVADDIRLVHVVRTIVSERGKALGLILEWCQFFGLAHGRLLGPARSGMRGADCSIAQDGADGECSVGGRA